MLIRKIAQGVVSLWRAFKTQGCGLSYITTASIALLLNRRKMDFLGKKLEYDAYLTPFFLHSFIPEINRFIIDPSRCPNPVVLDIGANFGGWAHTLTRLVPSATIYSFEPNPHIYALLNKNCAGNPNWKAYNFGIYFEDLEKKFYFVPGKSAQGSIHKENSNLDLLGAGGPQIIDVALRSFTSTAPFAQGVRHFDYVKVDVEGAELEVLRGLIAISWSYLYVEATRGDQRIGSNVEDVMDLITEQWGEVHVLLKRENSDYTVDLIVKSQNISCRG